MEVTLGGDRLGSGNKMKQELHNYNRSTFNQEQDFKSSMQCGTLYPFLCIPMTNGDSMDIDLDAFVRTLPTKGPLFGSFKMQCDIFSVPMRLYNGILHNNPTEIGLKMNQVYMPKITLNYDLRSKNMIEGASDYDWQIAPNSLWKYLGLSGIGSPYYGGTNAVSRKINAIPALAYYDIFKNYYANKQEKYAYIFTPQTVTNLTVIKYIEIYQREYADATWIPISNDTGRWNFKVIGNALSDSNIQVTFRYWDSEQETYITTDPMTIEDGDSNDYLQYDNFTSTELKFRLTAETVRTYTDIMIESVGSGEQWRSKIGLTSFELKNIDKMREMLLSHNQIGDEVELNTDWTEATNAGLPFTALYKTQATEVGDNKPFLNWNSFALNGLVVKTYQNDLFNNWINTEWIESPNGIAALSAVDVSEGTLEMDALNLAQKVYDMLNRIAVSGGTYEDWQEVVYTQESVRKAETPIYEGGMSGEIMFEEVISTAETDNQEDLQPLGSLGGKGTLIGTKGGKNIHIKAREPIFVMGIVSITPRICYTQGNEWYLMDLDSYDDLHKPGLDGIGFQDLMTDQMAWWDTQIKMDLDKPLIRHSAGKVVAWSNYMTAIDKAFGDFALPQGKGFMVLSRNYEITKKSNQTVLKDCTTYIDPSKFNYAFAYTDLASQNFWVQIHSKVTTRRVMSAHQIPNL